MQRLAICLAAVLAVALAAPASAQQCTTQVTAGHFDIEFQGATFDGTDTQFTYCVTGLDDPALSNWMLALDAACITEGDLVDCGPQPCYYQEDDPNLDLTGIKWDSVQVGPGDTVCFDFSLAGDWTALLGDVEIGLKAGQGVHYEAICGPVCVGCEASLEVSANAAAAAQSYYLRIEHRRPPTVRTEVRYSLYNSHGRRIRRWRSERFELVYGDVYEERGFIPGKRRLKPGTYVLEAAIRGMSRWHERRVAFQIAE